MSDPNEALVGEAFGQAFRAEQARNYGCAGDIECTFKFDGNCECFNTVLRQIIEAERQAVKEAALACQPSTAENPNESAYERGRFDGVTAFATAIRALDLREITQPQERAR
jgi:hypothetical protein